MFDIGWSELLLIAMVTLVVVGPREIPRVLRTIRGFLAKLRTISRDFQNTMDEAARAADLEDVKQSLLDDAPDARGEALFEKILGEDKAEEMREVAEEVHGMRLHPESDNVVSDEERK